MKKNTTNNGLTSMLRCITGTLTAMSMCIKAWRTYRVICQRDWSTYLPLGKSAIILTALVGYFYGEVNGFERGFAAWGATNLPNRDEFINVPAATSKIVQIAVGHGYYIALRENGTVAGWGDSYSGCHNIPEGLSNVKSIAANSRNAYAVKNDGSVVMWGDSSTNSSIPNSLTDVVEIACHSYGGLCAALKENGNVVAWRGDSVFSSPSSFTRIKQVAVSSSNVMALKEDGTVMEWGVGSPTGEPYFGNYTTPRPDNLSGVKSISANGDYHLALKEDGTVVAWGATTHGVCNVPYGLTGVREIEAGAYTSFAITDSGNVVKWGTDNSYGALEVPSGLRDVKLLCMGISHGMVYYDSDPDYYPAPVSFDSRHEVTLNAPSYVTVAFKLTDENGRGLNLTEEEVTADRYFDIKEDGLGISPSESFMQVAKIDHANARIKTVLMLDNSFSVAPNLAQLKEAAKTILAKSVANQEFAIYSFSGTPQLLQDFTSDLADLEQAIDSIGIGQPTTNLYGAVIEGLSRWTDGYARGEVTRGSLILLTDGSDQAGIHTLEQAIAARGDRQIYSIGLGDEIDGHSLRSLANAGNYEIDAVAELEGVFDQIQLEIQNDVNSLYWLNYVSPKRGNADRTLSIRIRDNSNTNSDAVLNATFNSSGFTDVVPQVVVNRGVFTPAGITSYSFDEATPITLKADTMLGFQGANFEWRISDPALLKLTVIANNQIQIQPLKAGTTTLSVIDLANDAIAPGYFEKIITITVPPSALPANTFSSWVSTYGLTGHDALAEADPNSDGISNFLSFAFGLNPVVVQGNMGSSEFPKSIPPNEHSDNRLQLQFTLPALTPPNLNYVVEQNCDLAVDSWIAIASSFGGDSWDGSAAVSVASEENGLRLVTVSSTETTESSDECFLRVRVFEQP